MGTGFYTNPIYLEHDTGNHPENAARLRAINQHLSFSGLLDELEIRSGRSAYLKEIQLLHSSKYIYSVEEAVELGRGILGTPDCVISPRTYDAALHAVGAVLDSVLEVAEGRLDNAFCAVRPPGHHAEYDMAMGFCFFNNIALAAEFLRKQYGYKRILIFDFDVHHGNGTQHLFEENDQVLYASTHQDPRTCYPGTGFASENGLGRGKGFTLNFPLPPSTTDQKYLEVFQNKIFPKFEEYKPDFILLSAGFDGHIRDPLAMLNLTENCYREITKQMKILANKFTDGRLVSMLEGGYDLEALAVSVEAHLQELLN
jgi:acetoin utilization deacetylase AcuC-like enzyme